MGPLESTIDIDLDPQHVFAYMTDPVRFPEWQRDVVAVRMADGATGTPGDRFTTTRWIGRGQRTLTQEITEIDFEAVGLAAALLPLVRRQASKVAPLSYRNLKEMLESGAARDRE